MMVPKSGYRLGGKYTLNGEGNGALVSQERLPVKGSQNRGFETRLPVKDSRNRGFETTPRLGRDRPCAVTCHHSQHAQLRPDGHELSAVFLEFHTGRSCTIYL